MEPKPVYSADKITIPPHTIVNVPIRIRSKLPEGRDFIFQPDEKQGTMYTHIVNSNFVFVPVTNQTSVTRTIPHRVRIGTIIENDDPTGYIVHPAEAALAATPDNQAQPKSNLRPKNSKETTLPNGITVYGDEATANALKEVLLKYNV